VLDVGKIERRGRKKRMEKNGKEQQAPKRDRRTEDRRDGVHFIKSKFRQTAMVREDRGDNSVTAGPILQ